VPKLYANRKSEQRLTSFLNCPIGKRQVRQRDEIFDGRLDSLARRRGRAAKAGSEYPKKLAHPAHTDSKSTEPRACYFSILAADRLAKIERTKFFLSVKPRLLDP
jgi:hypothetical protein